MPIVHPGTLKKHLIEAAIPFELNSFGVLFRAHVFLDATCFKNPGLPSPSHSPVPEPNSFCIINEQLRS